jgi:hypothetical protein
VQQRSLISIVFIALIAGLIVSLNVDNQDAQSGVSVITPSNTNTLGLGFVGYWLVYWCYYLMLLVYGYQLRYSY